MQREAQVTRRRNRPLPFLVGLLEIAAALALVACGGGGGNAEPPVEPPAAGASAPASTTVSGPDGATLVVPPAALAVPTTIRIAKDSSAAPPLPSVFAPVGDTFDVTPNGQALSVQAILRIPVDPAADDSVGLAESNADGTWTFRADAQRVGSMFEVGVSRLGQYRVVRFPTAAARVTAAARQHPHPSVCETFMFRLHAPGFLEATSDCGPGSGSLIALAPFSGPAVVPVTGEAQLGNCPLVSSVIAHPNNRNDAGAYVPLALQTTALTPTRAGPWTVDLRVLRPSVAGGTPSVTTWMEYRCVLTDGNAYGVYADQSINYDVTDVDGVSFFGSLDARSAAIGGSATFAIRVFGGPTPPTDRDQYRLLWERSGDDGAVWNTIGTSYQKEATDVSALEGGLHSIRLSNLAAADNGTLIRARACYAPSGQVEKCVNSGAARLTVAQDIVAPAIAQQPRSLSTLVGETADFSVAVTGTPTPSIRWQVLAGDLSTWVDVGSAEATWPGATPGAPTLVTLPGTLAQNGWLFRAVVSSAAGSATSETAVWRVTEQTVPTSIVTQPASTSVPLGATALLAIVAEGTAPLSYQWSKDGAPIAGATRPVLSLADVQAAALGNYRVSVTGPGGTATSNVAAVTAGTGAPAATLPTITTQPAPRSVVPGQVATFNVAVAGSPPPQCQWIRNSVAIPGATSCTSYSTPATTTADNGAVYNVVAYNAAGAVFGGGAVLTVTTSQPGVLALLAGDLAGTGSTDGAAVDARFNFPQGLTIDSLGNIYVVDCNSHTIRKISAAGVVSTLAGSPGLAGSADGIGSAARFNSPIGIAVDASFNLYVADNNNHTIRKITADGVVSTLAGLALSGGSADGTGSAARFQNPYEIVLDPEGNIYVADTYGYTIRKITVDGVVTTIAGSYGVQGSDDGGGAASTFTRVFGIDRDSAGNLYIADRDNHSIRKITPAGVVSTFAGLSGTAGSADGTGGEARFNTPQAVAIDADDNVFIADFGNHTIRKITPSGVVTTVVGVAGQRGVRLGSDPLLDSPSAIAIRGKGLVITSVNSILIYTLP